MAYNLSNFDKRPKMYQERNQGQRRDDHSYDYEMQQFQHFHEPAVIHEHADYVRHDKLRQPDNPSKINSEKQRQIDHLRQSNITHSDYLVSQTFENELPFYMRPRYLDSEMDRQTDYPSHKTFNKSGQHRSSRSYNQRYELKNDSHGRDLYRDTGQLVRRETERARSSLHKDEINTARESYHGMRSARAYDMLVDDFGDADIEREAKTELDEPIPDYAEDDGRLHHDVRQGDMYEIERDAPSLSQMHRNQVTKGKDNPAFTYDDWEHRRNEAEKRSQDQSEIMKPDRNRYQRERHDRHENYRRDNPSSGDESFTSEREKSQILTDRRKIRHRATIASPRDLQVSAHEAFNTIQRRKSERRMKSDLVDDRNSIFIETDNNENKLPSNRHAWTKPLNERIEALHTHRDESAHGFAGSLRTKRGPDRNQTTINSPEWLNTKRTKRGPDRNQTTINSPEWLNTKRDQILPKTQKKLGLLDVWKYQLAMTWLQLKNSVKSWVYQLELWAGHLKVIEGHFGTSTMTYFRFLRWLMFLNLLITIIMSGVVLAPFLALKPSEDSEFVSSVNACRSQHHFLASFFSQNYTGTINATRRRELPAQLVLDVLQGTGWLEHTELFYGSYFNRTISVPLIGEHVYNMDLAYMFAVGAVFLLNFILLVKNSAKGLKEGILTSSGGTITRYCNKVFGAWDFCITSEKTADIRNKNILQGLQSDLEFQRLQWRKAGRTTLEKVKLYFTRFIINILVLVILSGSLYLIYFCFTDDDLLELQQDTSLSEVVLLVLQYIPSLAITVLNVIVPLIFSKLVIAEDYMPAFGLRLTLLRTVLLRLASLGVLMGSLYDKLTGHMTQRVDINNTVCDNLQPTYNTTEPDQMCWETYVGQQLYKLLILNFLVAVFMTVLVKFPRKLIYAKLKRKYKLVAMVGQQRFDLNKSVLDLVYLQALCWLSLFFSPLTPAMSCVMCFVFFYVQKATLLYTCEPIQQLGTTKSNSLFMTALLLSFGLSAAPIIFMIGSIPPSRSCGPFRVYSSNDYVMFECISNLVNTFPAEVRDVLSFLAKGASMFVIALILCFSMYYFWAVGQAHHKMTKLLRDQLKQEGHDKQFLLARVNEALSQEDIAEITSNR